jgi:hypothetical protein
MLNKLIEGLDISEVAATLTRNLKLATGTVHLLND